MQIVATERNCRKATQKDLVGEERGSRDKNGKKRLIKYGQLRGRVRDIKLKE
jgi:hypothetical protein